MYRWKTEIHVPVLTFISQTNSYSSNFWLHELINQFIDLNKIHACIYLFSLRFPVTVKELTDENGLNKNKYWQPQAGLIYDNLVYKLKMAD